ncbi:unnamed protein product [Brassica napus]|uniref:(rape) hypothetical protein n=1 Tax=Brassica napus TaxID=3708 RepID=A0A816MYR2_BRANA|nr:unnamed protein product [Brassica napus]
MAIAIKSHGVWRVSTLLTPRVAIRHLKPRVEGEFSWDLARLQQRTRYHLFLAYSIKSCKELFLLYKANWRWEQLLEEGGAPLLVAAGGLSSAAMFYCKSCNFDCQSLKTSRNHFSSYKHGLEEAIKPPDTQLLCVTKTWARNYPATPEHATAKILVLWNVNDCPIPEGYDARVRPSIERAFKELGYSGVEYSRMTTDFRAWKVDNPAPASIMIISDEVASSKYRSSLICVDLQRSNYNCFLAYSARPFEMPVLLTSSEWLWDSLLSVKVKGLFQHLPECFVANCATVIAKAWMLSRSISQVKNIYRKYASSPSASSVSIDCLTI